jgi:hypothetical protein
MALASLTLLLAAGFFHLTAVGGKRDGARALEAGETRIKGGGFRMAFLSRAAGGALVPLADGDRLLPGDALQPVYSLPDSGYVHVLSMDAGGRVACYTCGTVGKLPPAESRALPFALEMEGGPGEELYLAAASAGPLDSASLAAPLRRAWEASGRDLSAAARILRRGQDGMAFKAVRLRIGRDS